MKPKVDVIGVPFDGCGPQRGSFLGPEALLHAGLIQSLEPLTSGAQKHEPFPLSWNFEPEFGTQNPHDESKGSRMIHGHQLVPVVKSVKQAVSKSIAGGQIPLVVGGDHSISIGSVSAALEAHGPNLVVLWIDAHADVHNPATSESGNIHGMPLGALSGRTEPPLRDPVNIHYWDRLLSEVVPPQRLNPNMMAWIGLRSVDPGESDFILNHHGCFFRTMQDIDRDGIGVAMHDFEVWFDRNPDAKLWISFDVDVLDPILAPGTGTEVRGGLTYREGHFIAERLGEFCLPRLAGVDLVEVNPLIDRRNETARIAVEWVASLFGKRILPKKAI